MQSNPLRKYIAQHLTGVVRPPASAPTPMASPVFPVRDQPEVQINQAVAAAAVRAAQERQAKRAAAHAAIAQTLNQSRQNANAGVTAANPGDLTRFAAQAAPGQAQVVSRVTPQEEYDRIGRLIEDRITRQHLINDAKSQGTVNPALVQQQQPPRIVVENLPAIAERWSQFTPEQQQGAIAQAQVIADQRGASQANAAAAAIQESGYDPLAGIITAVPGAVKDYAQGVGTALDQAGQQAVISGAKILDDPSVSRVKEETDPLVRTGVGVVGAAANLPGVNAGYDYVTGSMGDRAYDAAVGQKQGVTDIRPADVLQYTDTNWVQWTEDPNNKQTIIDRHTNGIDVDGDGVIDMTGGQAVYAEYLASLPRDQGLWVGENSLMSQIMRAAALDPLTYAALISGGAAGVTKALQQKVASGAALSNAEKMLYYAARGGGAVTTVPNALADAPFTAIGKTLGGFAEGIDRLTGGRVQPGKLVEPTVGEQINTTVNQADEALQNLVASRQAAMEPTGADEARLVQQGAALPDQPPVQTPTTGVTQPATPAQQGTGSGQYERVTASTGKHPRYGIIDPNGSVTEWVTNKGIEAADGTVIRPLKPGETPGGAAIKRRNELNTQLGQDQQAVGLDALGTPGGDSMPQVSVRGTDQAGIESGGDAIPVVSVRGTNQTGIASGGDSIANQSVPPADPLTGHWLDPKTGRKNPLGTRDASLYEHVDTELRPVAPALADAFDAAYKSDPRLPAFQETMRKFDASPEKEALRESGVTGKGLDSPEQVLEGIRHTVEVQKPIYRQTVGGEPPRWRHDYGTGDIEQDIPIGDRTPKGGTRTSIADERVVIEKAVFGTDAEARRARQWLHIQVGDLGGKIARATTPGEKTALLRRQAKYQGYLDETTRLRGLEIEAGGLPREATGAPATVLDEVAESVQPTAIETPTADAATTGIMDAPPARQGATISPEVPSLGTPMNEVDRHFEAGRLDQEARTILNQPIMLDFGGGSRKEVMTIAELFDEQAAIHGEVKGKQIALARIRAMERQAQGGTATPKGAARVAAKAYDAFRTASTITKEVVQYNIVTGARGTIGDAIGDGFTMSITGHAPVAMQQFDPQAVSHTFRVIAEAGDPAVLNNLDVAAPLRETGELLPIDVLPKVRVRDIDNRADVPVSGETTLHRQVMKVTGGRGQRFTGSVSGVFVNKFFRDLRSTFDQTRRLTLFMDQFRTNLADARASWEGLLRQKAQRAGADADAWLAEINDTARARVEADGGIWYGSFSPEDVRQSLGDESLARAWKAETSKAKRSAKAEVDRVLFSYRQTNVDKALSHVMFFHYWQSRALALHTRTALKNPWLLASYWRTWQLLKEKAEQEGYPASVTGFIRFMGESDHGWYGLFNPLGIIVPFTMFSEAGSEDQKWWQQVKPFLNPWIEGAAAAFGLTDQVPDPTGSWSVRNMIRTTLDWGEAHGIDFPIVSDRPSGDVVRTIEQKVYETANAALRSIGVPAKAFGPYDPQTTQIVQLRDRVEQIATDQWGPRQGWTPEQLAQVQDAKVRVETGANGNPLSEQAWRDYTDAQVGARLTGAAIPGGVRMVNADLTRRRDQSSAFFDNLDSGTTTPEQEAAADAMTETNAGSPEVIRLAGEQDAYNKIGTERQQNLDKGWNNIARAETLPAGGYEIGGRWYQTSAIIRMPKEQREILANQWVRDHEGTAELRTYREERDAYVASHPEYQGFDTYKDAVYQHDGGARGFRNRAEKDHPEFADELDQKRQSLKAEGKTGAVLENELDQWAASAQGYNAFRGVRQSIYDDEPKNAYDPSKDAFGGSWGAAAGTSSGGSSSGGSGGKVQSLKKKLAVYQAKMQMAEDLIGTDPTRLSPAMRRVYEVQGILPEASTDLLLYLEWGASQPQGSDNTIEAYVAYLDALEDAEGLAAD